jgi:hypothetical protein
MERAGTVDDEEEEEEDTGGEALEVAKAGHRGESVIPRGRDEKGG